MTTNAQQTTRARKTRGMAPDDPRRGMTVQPVLLLFLLGGAEICVWIWCNIQQITATHDAALGLIQGNLIIPSHLTTAQVVDFVNGNLDHANKVAYTIAFVTQIIFQMIGFPISYIHGRLAVQHGYHPSGKGFVAHASEIRRHITLRRVVFLLFFVGEIWTDALYAITNNRDWVTPILYLLAMWAGSTIVGLDGWQRISGVWSVVASALHQQAAEQGGV